MSSKRNNDRVLDQILCLGYLKQPRSLLGHIKVKSYGELLNCYSNGDLMNYYSAKRVFDGFLDHPHHKYQISIESINPYNHGYLLKPKGINTREEAETHCGFFLGLPLEEAQEKFGGSSEPYLFEYLNLKIIEYQSEQYLGDVIRIEEIQERVFLVIQLCDNVENDKTREIMLPIKSDYVAQIDIKKKVLRSRQLHELI